MRGLCGFWGVWLIFGVWLLCACGLCGVCGWGVCCVCGAGGDVFFIDIQSFTPSFLSLQIPTGGYSGLQDVRQVPPMHNDKQESFWLAETLKVREWRERETERERGRLLQGVPAAPL